jgi:DNA-binding transcriptional LysR family regulator
MQIAAMFDWGDLRHFLGVAREGSTLAAARALGVNQTTVARRIQALEEAIGETLFDRAAGGYRLTALGQAVLPQAEQVEAAVADFRGALSRHGRRAGGVIRVTTNDVFADVLVTPWLGEFMDRFPGVQVETIISNDRLDISKGEADIAIRASMTPTEGEGMVMRKLTAGNWGVYASPAYAEKHGVPRSSADLGKHPIIGVTGDLKGYEPDVWKRARAAGAIIRNASSTIGHISSAIKGGLGVGPIPCIMGQRDGLVLGFIVLELAYEIQLITRADMKGLSHVRAFNDFIAARTAALRPMILGPDDAPRE